MVENGIKPAYVFDGKPPELKSGVVSIITHSAPSSPADSPGQPQLSKRFERREEAKEAGEEAKETGKSLACGLTRSDSADPSIGTAEDMDKFTRRTVKVTREHNEECRKLLGLMGIPVVVVWISLSFPLVIVTRS